MQAKCSGWYSTPNKPSGSEMSKVDEAILQSGLAGCIMGLGSFIDVIRICRRGKAQPMRVKWPYIKSIRLDTYKLFLSLAVIALLGAVVWTGIMILRR